ncbi:MAG: hypothetical protein NW226_16835 [Microscillaceae bacterium]|nr:hypothetical protein [Microscillaceae bacterium]
MQSLPNLPIYDAYQTNKDSSLIALIVAAVMTPIILGISASGLGTYQTAESKWIVVLVYSIFTGFLVLLSAGLFRVYLRNKAKIQAEKQLFTSKAVFTKAKIVGRVCEDGGEYADSFYVYYQFRADFIVKAELVNKKEKSYYDLPIGSSIDIEYISDNPTQSRLYSNRSGFPRF